MLMTIKSSNKRLCLLICFYVVYLFCGASVFDALESPYEAKTISDLNKYVRLFRDRHNACVSDQDLNDFIQLISVYNDKGVPATNNVSKEQNWSFGQSVFYAGTVLTTIGYGNVSPLTKLGKIFCMLFAIVGIPVTLLLLYAIIERLMKLTGYLLASFTQQMLRVTSCMQRSHIHVLFALLSALFVLIVFFLIPAAIYSHIEHWSYLNAFYYCFISLTTVGLGDYVPGDSDIQDHRHLYDKHIYFFKLINSNKNFNI
jgi:potassium channel subfamily K protein 1